MSSDTQTQHDVQEILRLGQQRMARVMPDTDWQSATRKRGTAGVATMARPDRKQEAWRYTPLGFLDQAEFQPIVEGPFDALQLSDIDDLMLTDPPRIRLVFVNGYLASGLCAMAKSADGVTLSSLAGGLGEVPAMLRQQLDAIAEHNHVFAALNSALMSDGALIHLAAGVHLDGPIEILHVSVGLEQPGICHPRHLIVLEDGARAEVIERYCGLGDGAYFTNALIEVSLGSDSELLHQRMQEESPHAQHLSDLQVHLGARSLYRLTLAALGGAWSRNDVRVTFGGEGATAELDGLMLARDRQFNDVHLDVRHEVPHCTSRETFKGILDGSGRLVFDGHIVVARDAQKTDAVLSNRNLMLARSAEVDTKPQLEIYADDVKCSHGTTVGELDPDMLFYLRSRGIPADQAKQMLCQGFAQEVFDTMASQALRARAGQLLASRLMTSTPEQGER